MYDVLQNISNSFQKKHKDFFVNTDNYCVINYDGKNGFYDGYVVL